MSEVTTTPPSKARAADAASSPPIDAGSCSETVMAPASVSRAASACPSVRIDGSTIPERNCAARMLPSTAVPSTAPSSYAVSDTADAAPAFAGGALERISSFETVSAAPMPTPSSTKAIDDRGDRPRVRAECDHEVSGGREPQRHRHEHARAHPTGDRHDDEAGRDHRDEAGQECEPGLHRAEPRDELQVLRDEVEEPDERDDAEEVHEHGAAERALAEEPHVEHGRVAAELPAHEPDRAEHAQHDRLHAEPRRRPRSRAT